MIPNYNNRTVIDGGVADSVDFGISRVDEAHIMSILRDTLYSDKVLAVLREYSANAWDAHRSIGKGDLPIKVVCPTDDEPTLVIRDFGPGLSHDDVFKVYSQYGASTKRSDDNSVGMLGIGSKSAFAYADSFTITSWHGGSKNVYVAVLDQTEKGQIKLMHKEACDPSETGVEIRVAVKPEDITEFVSTARRLFQHFEPRPNINIDLPAPPTDAKKLAHGTLRKRGSYNNEDWIAVMGCIPYRIDATKLPTAEVGKFLPKLVGTLKFGIGEVQIAASREQLKYSPLTNQALLDKILAVVDEYVTLALNEIEQAKLSMWDARLRVIILDELGLPIPKAWKDLAEGHVTLEFSSDVFTVNLHGNATTTIDVEDETRLLILDDKRDLKGFGLRHYDYIIRPQNNTSVDEVRLFLDEACEKAGITGVTIGLLSSITWTEPYVPGKKKRGPSNPKHRAKMFKLDLSELPLDNAWRFDKRNGNSYSDYWTIEDRVPQDDDVWCLVSKFESTGCNVDVLVDLNQMRRFAKEFGATLPPAIWGYKTSETKPAKVDKIVGVHYDTWRASFLDSLITPATVEQIHQMFWQNVLGERRYSDDYFDMPYGKQLVGLTKALGEKHPIVEFATRASKQNKPKADEDLLELLALRAKLKIEDSEGRAQLVLLKQRYPLLGLYKFSALWESTHSWHDEASKQKIRGRRRAWREYVRMIDEALDAENKPAPVLKILGGAA